MAIKIGPVFNKILQERRLTVKEIATATGVPASTLAEWRSNRTPKNPDQVRAVAEFIGIPLHELLFGEPDRQDPITKIIREDVFQGTFEVTIRRVKL